MTKISYNIKGGKNKVDSKYNEALINKIAKAKDDHKVALAWELAELNFSLVFYVLGRHFNSAPDQDVIISDGMMSLFKACKRV